MLSPNYREIFYRIIISGDSMQEQKQEYMRQALALAQRGAGHVNPNPMVGAVLVKDGRIIGEGYHTRYGQLHAEREAFKNAAERGEETAGADLYVTLEPCCHTGKQPPCTEAVLDPGEARDCRLHGSESGGGRARHPASEGKRAGSGGRNFTRGV